jgi:hypothetical protein
MAEIGDADSHREPIPIVAELMEPDFSPRLGTYYYRFHWLLKTGAKTEISIERKDDDFVVATSGKTGWLVDKIYRVRYRGAAILNAVDLSPVRVDVKEEVRSTRKQTRMVYRGETIFSERVKKKKNKDPRYESFQQSTRGGRVMDPFSATLIARAMPWATGDLRTIDVFDGRRLNRVTMTCVGQSRVKAAGEKHDAWVIKISITQGDPEDLDEDDELITDQITAYLAANHSREVLQMEADTKFGDIKVVLESFEAAD